MQLTVFHETAYRYADPPSRSTQYIRLSPYPSARQRVIDWTVEMPGPAIVMKDAFDNITHVLALDVEAVVHVHAARHLRAPAATFQHAGQVVEQLQLGAEGKILPRLGKVEPIVGGSFQSRGATPPVGLTARGRGWRCSRVPGRGGCSAR